VPVAVLLRPCGFGPGVLVRVAFEVASVLGLGVELPLPRMRGLVAANGELGADSDRYMRALGLLAGSL